VNSKTYTQNKQPSDKTQSLKFCQLGVKRTRFQNRKKKGNDFFDRCTTLISFFMNDRFYIAKIHLVL